MLLNGMRAVPNLLVASLAVSDLLQVIKDHWPFNDTACKFQGYVIAMLAVALISHKLVLAVNRYDYRIVNPVTYRRYFTKKKKTQII